MLNIEGREMPYSSMTTYSQSNRGLFSFTEGREDANSFELTCTKQAYSEMALHQFLSGFSLLMVTHRIS